MQAMQPVDARERFDELPEKAGPRQYNYEHFRTEHFLADARGTIEHRGIQPGEPAPDFELTRTDGHIVRLAELRGKPVLLHFGSPT